MNAWSAVAPWLRRCDQLLAVRRRRRAGKMLHAWGAVARVRAQARRHGRRWQQRGAVRAWWEVARSAVAQAFAARRLLPHVWHLYCQWARGVRERRRAELPR